ncbi:MAG: PepSY domain-containing protein [Hyphomonadaceae bacterium]
MLTRSAFVAALAAALLWPGGAEADRGRGRGGDHDEALEARERREALPLPRILDIARSAVPGDPIEVELEREDGRLIYEVEILARNGRVRKVEIDARTGAVLEVEDE